MQFANQHAGGECSAQQVRCNSACCCMRRAGTTPPRAMRLSRACPAQCRPMPSATLHTHAATAQVQIRECRSTQQRRGGSSSSSSSSRAAHMHGPVAAAPRALMWRPTRRHPPATPSHLNSCWSCHRGETQLQTQRWAMHGARSLKATWSSCMSMRTGGRGCLQGPGAAMCCTLHSVIQRAAAVTSVPIQPICRCTAGPHHGTGQRRAACGRSDGLQPPIPAWAPPPFYLTCWPSRTPRLLHSGIMKISRIISTIE